MDKITIVVVDDHPLFRQGVVDSLQLEADFAVVGQAASGEEGLDLIRSLLPRAAVVDVNLPAMNGQQVTRQIALEKIPTQVILLTAYDDTEQKIHAMRSGASAYCTKDIQPEQLAWTIRQVLTGGFVIGERLMDADSLDKWISEHTDGAMRLYGDPGEPYQPLSSREMQVLIHVTNGLSNKEIAILMGISHQTVKNHVTSILRKLGVGDRTQAALYALRRGWVRLHGQTNEVEE
ncbi:MAG: response regulator transcription factor [Chloroflexota bacterium]